MTAADVTVPAAAGRTPSPFARLRRRWGRLPARWRWCIGVYLGTRAVVAGGMVTAALVLHHPASFTGAAHKWDGFWYLFVAKHWYSSSLRPPGIGGQAHRHSEWAFFPTFPAIVRGLHVLAVPYPASGVAVSLVVGLMALVAVYWLGEVCAGPLVGRWAAALVAAWPASAVFGLPYSEGLYVATTAVALAALLRHRWWLAGLAGGIATGTRASGVAVIAAAAVAALLAIARGRDYRSLAAPILSAGGIVAFLAYGWARTGDIFVWRHAENLWRQTFDFGVPMYGRWTRVFTTSNQVLRWADLVEIFGAACLVAVVVRAWRHRSTVSPVLATYVGVSLVLLLGYSAVGTRPRMVLGVVPLFVWAAEWLRPYVTRRIVLAMVPLLFGTTYLYMWHVVP